MFSSLALLSILFGLCRGQCHDLLTGGIADNDLISTLLNPNTANITGDSGTFASPGYPTRLSTSSGQPPTCCVPFYFCHWVITVDDNRVIEATVSKLGSTSCTYCSLTVVDGTGVFGGKYKTAYTFNSAVKSYSSSTNSLGFIFYGFAPYDATVSNRLAFSVNYTSREIRPDVTTRVDSGDQATLITAVASLGAFVTLLGAFGGAAG